MPDQITPVRWQPDRTAPHSDPRDVEWGDVESGDVDSGCVPWPVPEFSVAVGRGARGLCPACGQTHAFNGYLSVVPECTNCGAPLGRFRADDAPPYFTILIVGHLLVPLMFWVETTYHPPLWLHAAIWLPAATLLTLGLLRPVKGAVLGWMLRLGIMKAEE